ncbi:MAG: helix-hairpin-helix domain-containing protein [Arenicellales bacterium]
MVLSTINTLAALVLTGAMLASQVLRAEPVDINTADAQNLSANITGVGPVLAEAIVAYRAANGPFLSAKDLLAVHGIGEKIVLGNPDTILVDGKTFEN